MIQDPPEPEPCCFSKERALESTSNSGRDEAILSFGTKRQLWVASRTHGVVCRSCYYSVFLVTQVGTQPDCDHGCPFPGSGLLPGKVQSKKPISVLQLTSHHSSFPNQKLIPKTLHPPDVTCGEIRKKTGKDSLMYSTLHML